MNSEGSLILCHFFRILVVRLLLGRMSSLTTGSSNQAHVSSCGTSTLSLWSDFQNTHRKNRAWCNWTFNSENSNTEHSFVRFLGQHRDCHLCIFLLFVLQVAASFQSCSLWCAWAYYLYPICKFILPDSTTEVENIVCGPLTQQLSTCGSHRSFSERSSCFLNVICWFTLFYLPECSGLRGLLNIWLLLPIWKLTLFQNPSRFLK